MFSGIAVVIDDEIDNEKANINNLIRQIENGNMPCLKYKELPTDNLDHFEGISFLLLDWQLLDISDYRTEGVKPPANLLKNAIDENIDFLKKLRDKYFVPIFIFTNEPKEDVIKHLNQNGLYHTDKPNYIFIKNKDELKGRTKLLKTVEEWARKTPSIYVAKEWEKEYSAAKNKMFQAFYDMGPNWPITLWKTFSEDGVNNSKELGETITRNLHTRMTPFYFDAGILNKKNKKVLKDELCKVLEGARFAKRNQLHDDDIATGDVFKESSKLYLNIRPDCDCVPRNSSIEDVMLYVLKGIKKTNRSVSDAYEKKYGQFREIDTQSIVFSMIDGKTYEFSFKNIILKPWKELKDKRIGRLLPPYITRIQQRYALYLTRQGLPRTPKDAV